MARVAMVRAVAVVVTTHLTAAVDVIQSCFPGLMGRETANSWCVGPKFQVEADGLMLFRDDPNWDPVIGFVGGTTSLIDHFDHGIGRSCICLPATMIVAMECK